MTSYSDRQQAQFRKFMAWVKTEGGVEGPTQLGTLFKPQQLARLAWLKNNAEGYTLEVGCLLPGTPVVTNQGLISIENIGIGDRVLTHRGLFQRVQGVSTRNFSGLIMGLRPRYSNATVWLTPEHPVLAMPVAKQYQGWKAKPVGEPRWVAAGELTADYWMVYPILQTSEPTPLHIPATVKPRGRGGRPPVPAQVPVTEDVAEFCGRFVGDGHARVRPARGGHSGEVSIVFADAEGPEADRLADIVERNFNIKTRSVRAGPSAFQLCWYSYPLADAFVRHFGKSAAEKHLPVQYLGMSQMNTHGLLRGLLGSDGTFDGHGYDYCTVSPFLAWELDILFNRVGALASVQRIEGRPGCVINGRTVQTAQPVFHIRARGGPGRTALAKYLGNHLISGPRSFTFGSIDQEFRYVPLFKREVREYTGPVYNLSVEKDESFCTPALALHNCNFGAVLAYMAGHVGVDISPMNIELARLLSHDAEFHVADATALPFPNKTFQTVAVPETLEHLDFPNGVRLAIQEACRVAWDRVLVTMPEGSTDTEEATSFKHCFLLDEPTLAELLQMFPPGGRSTVERTEYFVLIRYDLEGSS
mgnify:CR=1 FL=1